MEIGIVGLPNVGKSSLFNLLTKAGAESQNFPFTTIEPNVGVVAVPDERLEYLAGLYSSAKIVPSTIKFVDIAGLVKGASKGEGLGNQFLGNIRSVDAIVQVVRLFNDDNVIHIAGKIDPISDIETINTELMLADLDQLNRRLDRLTKDIRAGDKAAIKLKTYLDQAIKMLDRGQPVRSDKELAKNLITENLLSSKPLIYLVNCDTQVSDKDLIKISELAKNEGSAIVRVFVKDELEIIDLPIEEQKEYRSTFGIGDTLTEFIHASYKLLNLITFFTAGPKESHAWPIEYGTLAPQAAGKIHTDFEKGFIRAQVYNIKDIKQYGSESALKENGLIRTEGKTYQIQDGDIVEFLFNV